ncbi:DUF2726 domain-containing protein [Salmonella enterica]|nr:DUF2726 domain-containing protein [Salmonella enterica]
MSIYIIGFVAIVILLFGASSFSGSDKKTGHTAEQLFKSDGYVKKPFMTQKERIFFKKLRESLDENYNVFAQVRLVDVVSVSESLKSDQKKRNTLFRKISQWHCDYIVTNGAFDVIVAIELDDKTHQRQDRIKRDNYFNEVFKQVGIPLIRVRNIDEINLVLHKINPMQ